MKTATRDEFKQSHFWSLLKQHNVRVTVELAAPVAKTGCSPLVPGGPCGPAGPCAPWGSWPFLKSAESSEPFFTFAAVTALFFSWSVPIELRGTTRFIAAWPTGVAPSTAA